MASNGKIHIPGWGGQGLESRALGGVTTGTVAQAAGPVSHLSPVTTSRQQRPMLHLMGVSGKDDIQGERFFPYTQERTRGDSIGITKEVSSSSGSTINKTSSSQASLDANSTWHLQVNQRETCSTESAAKLDFM